MIVGLRKPSEMERHEIWDAQMRSQYIDPIENFPHKIDQLLAALNRVSRFLRINSVLLVIYLAVHDAKNWTNLITFILLSCQCLDIAFIVVYFK